MDLLKILADLRSEQSWIDDAIFTLERLASKQTKRRGRPPKWMAMAQERPRTKSEGRKAGKRDRPNQKESQ
jgi:hypothetical protein